MRRVYTGVTVNNYSVSKGSPWLMQNNNLQTYAGGLWHNQSYSAGDLDDDRRQPVLRTASANPVANNIGILSRSDRRHRADDHNNTIEDHELRRRSVGHARELTLDSTNSISDASVGVYVTE